MDNFHTRLSRPDMQSLPKPLRCWVALVMDPKVATARLPLQMDCHILFINEAPGPTICGYDAPSRESMQPDYEWSYQF